jgi:hypothetical protein
MGPLIPLAISLAPEIGKWLFGGPAGEQIARAVEQAVASVTGTSDEAAAQQAIVRDPQLAMKLRLHLAQLAAQQDQAARRAELEELAIRFGDMRKVRGTVVASMNDRNTARWAAPIVSIVVLLTFAVVMWAALTRVLPAGSEAILNTLLGTLAAMATTVVGYWVGSSAGSAQKTDLLARGTPAVPPKL